MPKIKEGSKDVNYKLFDNNSLRIIILASIIIISAVIVTGGISYVITKNAVIEKLQNRDLFYIAQSITAKVDARIEKAQETSQVLAKDSIIKEWIQGKEKDEEKGILAKKRIAEVVKDHDYDSSFIVSNLTYNYWTEDGKLIDVMSKDDEDDSWFFDVLENNEPISISLDYNNERKNTFAFMNALMMDKEEILAVVGIGIDFKDISEQFKSYKFGEKSNMWLIDKIGNIYISEDTHHLDKNISNFLPHKIINSDNFSFDQGDNSAKVIDYKNADGITYDLIFQKLESTDWGLILQIPREESIAFIDSIKINTLIACLITIFLLVIMFYLISNKIANPYKRAIELNREMEQIVKERTLELKEKNQNIIDSIEYARMIQESILPSPKEMDTIFKENFIFWKPRDIVGGDFYYTKIFESGSIVIIGDCTGHGVPGALMTMTVNSILNYIIDEESIKNPGNILSKLNIHLKQTLYGRSTNSDIDDGLDAGIVYIGGAGECIFAGARISLLINNKDKFEVLEADKKGIGYKNTPDNYDFKNQNFNPQKGDIIYMTTDGYIHQNGGEKDFSLGKTKFMEILQEVYEYELSEQKLTLEEKLLSYMGENPQRDDIAVIGFKPPIVKRG
ncbi:Serine phosphatase RsbU, regulator of sigma subunit [Desulfonispora thiosulfatigenes DSM 11270]|uniref:Serine phosphatase RsbU, regulator of sigma subunit n=1 Tax=Desulfonispora thiosulfatigenes DSM 11270 TaxID=656914 RepID=A0A1W1VBH2_DESTI|nr:SpoIIE family protein phosphatase [Desulfonispora thiosulfatigenes]SMB90324.1 Serine phosphatase RsbU, regulator of sigma subunit [Desulfonispora thiosulfatigenes DSM 11270]